MNATSAHEKVKKAWALARAIRVPMLTTLHAASLAARPMYAIIPDRDEVIWFITERGSAKVADAGQSPEALLTFSDGPDGDHLVMAGNITVINDRLKLKSLWNAGADIFFPKGPTDQAAVLLRFDPTNAEYWTGGSGLIAFAINFVTAKITGGSLGVGDHATVNL